MGVSRSNMNRVKQRGKASRAAAKSAKKAHIRKTKPKDVIHGQKVITSKKAKKIDQAKRLLPKLIKETEEKAKKEKAEGPEPMDLE